MTIHHHPSHETLVRHAAGSLAAGPDLVVASHLIGCPECRVHVADLEAVAGVLLQALAPTPLADDALARALASLDEPAAATPAATDAPPRSRATLPDGLVLPPPLRSCRIGRWRWLGPGIRFSRVGVPGDRQARVMLLKVGPGRALPQHGHEGIEFTQVLHGSFSDGLSRYFPGDFAEADADVDHQPTVDPEGECICLVALGGRMRIHGLFGRLLQPLAGV